MDQFQTAFLGGYRKDLVDERLKDLVEQMEKMRREVQTAREREKELKAEMAAAQSQLEAMEAERKLIGEWDVEAAREREKSLKEELAAARSRLEVLEEASSRTKWSLPRAAVQADNWKVELAAALRWAESLEVELRLAQEEQEARAQSRISDLEHTKELNERITGLEEEWERQEAEYRRGLQQLQEQLELQNRGYEAAARVMRIAEHEARSLVEDARTRVQQMERQTEEHIRLEKAAEQALKEACVRVTGYLDAFQITRDKLAAAYNELDALAEQIPREFPDDTTIEMDYDT